MKLTENPAKNRLLARLIAFILFLFLLLLSSCKTASNTTAIVPVHSATHDRAKTEFRYRLLRDTVYKTRTDTIPVVKQVPVVKKERYTPPFTKFLGIIALGAISIFILFKFKRS